MKKIVKRFMVSIMVAVIMVVSGACSSWERIGKYYNSKEEFVADFGAKLEKINPEDGCCLFDEEVIQSSVKEVLQCEMGEGSYKAYVFLYESLFGMASRYEYQEFSYLYTLLSQDEAIGALIFGSAPATDEDCSITNGNGKDRYEFLGQILVENIDVEIYDIIEEREGERNWFAAFYTENTFNTITLTICDEQLQSVFMIDDFISLIEPIIESRNILK